MFELKRILIQLNHCANLFQLFHCQNWSRGCFSFSAFSLWWPRYKGICCTELVTSHYSYMSWSWVICHPFVDCEQKVLDFLNYERHGDKTGPAPAVPGKHPFPPFIRVFKKHQDSPLLCISFQSHKPRKWTLTNINSTLFCCLHWRCSYIYFIFHSPDKPLAVSGWFWSQLPGYYISDPHTGNSLRKALHWWVKGPLWTLISQHRESRVPLGAPVTRQGCPTTTTELARTSLALRIHDWL